jgi:hypothetical protein
MGRVAITVLCGAATVALAIWLAARTWGAEAERTGRSLYVYRRGYVTLTTPPRNPVPLVAWMGDSTIMGVRRPSYPQVLAPRLRERVRTDSRVIAGAAFDFYTYYYLMGPVLDLKPDLIVAVAHLSTFALKRTNRFTYNDLCSMVPTAELPRAALLPFAARRLSIARLMLARLLRLDAGEQALFFFEGLRSLYQDAPAWKPLGPREPPLRIDPREVATAVKAYDIPVSRLSPLVRMMGATVRMASDRGTEVLVIGIPIPHETLRKRWRYDEAVYARRFAVLRAVVEENGGRFLDLHEALETREFADVGGHYNPDGVAHMASLVEPEVLKILEQVAAGRTAPVPPS